MTDQSKVATKVFVSYAAEDSSWANYLIDGLRRRGVETSLVSNSIDPAQSVRRSMREHIAASSYILLLVSTRFVKSAWTAWEMDAALRESTARGVTVIPILIEPCEVPVSLRRFRWLDLTSDAESDVEWLAESLKAAPHIDFSRLDAHTFEELVVDLLLQLGFTIVEKARPGTDLGFDFIATHETADPFGAGLARKYAVETKLYRHSRADLRSLHQLVHLMKTWREVQHGVLVTNGQLTSVARDWLTKSSEAGDPSIHVVDGPALQQLLLGSPGLVRKYFATAGEGSNE
jgi:hypothetical protein